MSHPPRQKRSPAQWQQLVEAQAASGQSQVAFCTEHRLSRSSFQLWKRRSRLRQSPEAAAPPALFAPLISEPGPAESDTGWTVELDLGDGVCLRLGRSAS
ncbi:MAG: hypothetical protein PF501_10835 [Salinisphaera sp.]|jgi:putative transposase|nr:hypothetical protein [Salinisphaera sp.]